MIAFSGNSAAILQFFAAGEQRVFFKRQILVELERFGLAAELFQDSR